MQCVLTFLEEWPVHVPPGFTEMAPRETAMVSLCIEEKILQSVFFFCFATNVSYATSLPTGGNGLFFRKDDPCWWLSFFICRKKLACRCWMLDHACTHMHTCTHSVIAAVSLHLYILEKSYRKTWLSVKSALPAKAGMLEKKSVHAENIEKTFDMAGVFFLPKLKPLLFDKLCLRRLHERKHK